MLDSILENITKGNKWEIWVLFLQKKLYTHNLYLIL